MNATTLHVEGAPPYTIHIGEGVWDTAETYITKALGALPRRAFLVTQTAVHAHALRLRQALPSVAITEFLVPEGESAKAFEQLQTLLDAMLAEKPDRHTPILAVGGGVVGDLAGFAASVLLRGVPLIQCPTTLLAQVDSSVGGKTAVNSRHGKNLIGSFYPPRLVLADSLPLTTLPRREWLAGYAEIVKYGLLGDASFFAWLESNAQTLLSGNASALTHAIQHSCGMKAAIVSRDPLEKGERALLNLGHSFGHALEKAFGYDGRLLHGEAVAIGMVMAAELSSSRGMVAPADVARIRSHLSGLGLPVAPPPLPKGISAAWLTDVMTADKKSINGNITLILLQKLGQAIIQHEVPKSEVEACWLKILADC